MLGTVPVGLFYRQLLSRVRTTAGQDSRGRGLLQTGSRTRTCGCSATIRCQVEFKAVWQKLHGTCELLGPVAERPEHGGGVSRLGHGVRG